MSATHENAGIAANSDVKAKATIKSYDDCIAFLGAAFTKQLASNVRVEGITDHGDVFSCGVILYDTEIVTYYSDETFTVQNGGFNTPTTSRRVTQFTPDKYVFFHANKKLTANNEKQSAEGRRLPV